jgi:hypothetical protein
MSDDPAPSRVVIGVSDSDVTAIRKLRLREGVARFLHSWWAPLISGVAGLTTGAALKISSSNDADYTEGDSYPYAAAVVGLSSSLRRGADRRSIVLAVSIVVFILAFIAGIGTGDALDGESPLGATTRYGVYHERR